MNTKREHLTTIIRKNKLQFYSFVLYVSFIVISLRISIPLPLKIITYAVLIITECFYMDYVFEWIYKNYSKNKGLWRKVIVQEVKKIAKEIIMFIPVFIISIGVIYFVMTGIPENEEHVKSLLFQAPFFYTIMMVIVGPVTEEFVFRFLPYKFMKNKFIYIVVSAVVFAAMHVVNDPNPFYYFWFYMIRPLYYGYRYYKTKDILVPIAMHILNNLYAVIVILFV